MNRTRTKIGHQLGEGGHSTIYEVTADGKKYACKVFFTKKAFERETAAYERMRNVDALRGRVPTVHSVPAPFVMLMEKAEGTSLLNLISEGNIPATERSTMHRELTETVNLLHREAGVYHGDIRPQNIMVKDGHTTLLDFSLAVMDRRYEGDDDVDIDYVDEGEHTLYDGDEDAYAKEDHLDLNSIFYELGVNEAHQEALDLTKSILEFQPQGCSDAQEAELAAILRRTNIRSTELLDNIMKILPAPNPSITLWASAGLLGRRTEEAIAMIQSCLARYTTPESRSSVSDEVLLELRVNAARYAGRAAMFDGADGKPSTEVLHDDAVEFYLKSSPGACERTPADEMVLDLREELVERFKAHGRYYDALRICVLAIEEARAVGKDSGKEKLGRFADKVKWLLRDVEDRQLWDHAAKLTGYGGNTYEQIHEKKP